MKKLLVAALAFMTLSCAAVNEPFEEREWRTRVLKEDPAMLRAPHFSDGNYFNPWLPMKEQAFGSCLMMRMFGKKETAYTDRRNNTSRGCFRSQGACGRCGTISFSGSATRPSLSA